MVDLEEEEGILTRILQVEEVVVVIVVVEVVVQLVVGMAVVAVVHSASPVVSHQLP